MGGTVLDAFPQGFRLYHQWTAQWSNSSYVTCSHIPVRSCVFGSLSDLHSVEGEGSWEGCKYCGLSVISSLKLLCLHGWNYSGICPMKSLWGCRPLYSLWDFHGLAHSLTVRSCNSSCQNNICESIDRVLSSPPPIRAKTRQQVSSRPPKNRIKTKPLGDSPQPTNWFQYMLQLVPGSREGKINAFFFHFISYLILIYIYWKTT